MEKHTTGGQGNNATRGAEKRYSWQHWPPLVDASYLLGPRIGSGGMGIVHLGLKRGPLGFRRLVAVKRLHEHLANHQEFVSLFIDEIQLAARIDHPNVVRTLDVLRHGMDFALIMEFVEGVSFDKLLMDATATEGRLAIPVAVGVLVQALHGLHSAHELVSDLGGPLNLVHRDVSPQNLMVGKDGLVKVLDFGIAKTLRNGGPHRPGHQAGKASYMAPEQARGAAVDRRTDVFAAAVVLWEALTGCRPRPAVPVGRKTLRQVLETPIPPPRTLRPEVSPALERVVQKALSADPAQRFGSAMDFAAALDGVTPGASLTAVSNGLTKVSGHRLQAASPESGIHQMRSDSSVQTATGSRDDCDTRPECRAGNEPPIPRPAPVPSEYRTSPSAEIPSRD